MSRKLITEEPPWTMSVPESPQKAQWPQTQGGSMKGRIRKSAQPVYRSRDPGPRELQRRYMDRLYEKAEQKPRPPVSPQKVAKP